MPLCRHCLYTTHTHHTQRVWVATSFWHHAASVPFYDTALAPVTFSHDASGANVAFLGARSPSFPPSLLPLYILARDRWTGSDSSEDIRWPRSTPTLAQRMFYDRRLTLISTLILVEKICKVMNVGSRVRLG